MLKKVTWRYEVADLPANLMEPYFISMYNYKYIVKDIFFFNKKKLWFVFSIVKYHPISCQTAQWPSHSSYITNTNMAKSINKRDKSQ